MYYFLALATLLGNRNQYNRGSGVAAELIGQYIREIGFGCLPDTSYFGIGILEMEGKTFLKVYIFKLLK